MAQRGTKGAFLKQLVKLYADEFDTTGSAVLAHLRSGDPTVGEYFANWLRSQGWQVTWYCMPIPDQKYFEHEHGEWSLLSCGLLFADSCDKLVAWRLSNP